MGFRFTHAFYKMKKIFFIFLLSLWFKGFSQTRSIGYTAVYNTEVKAKIKVDFKPNVPVTREDSILNDFSKLFFKKVQAEDIVLILRDSVRICNDTTYIKSVAEDNYFANANTQINMNIKASERILYKNKFFIKNDTTSTFRPSIGDYEKFTYSKKDTTILGYNAKIYQNETKTIKIWVANRLPTGLNPAIRITNPSGGILKYEIVRDDQIIVSILNNISEYELEK